MKTLNYSEQSNSFQSFIDIDAKHYVEVDGYLYYIDSSGQMYKAIGGNIPEYFNESTIRFVVNQDMPYTKTFDNIELYAGSISSAIISAEFKTSTQQSLLDNSNIITKESTMLAAIPRENTNNVSRMRDKLITCTYRIKNDDKVRFSIPYIKTKYRYSVI
jgi:hypothetical protein